MGTIKISKESMEKFNHQERRRAQNRVPCPINNGADLNSDAMLENLFDEGECIEHGYSGHYISLGFIEDIPFKVEYDFRDNKLMLSCMDFMKGKEKFNILKEEIEKRLTDEEVEPDINFYTNLDGKQYFAIALFYYTEEWAEQFNS